MQTLGWDTIKSSDTSERATTLFQQSENDIHKRADRLFAKLMVLQWLAGIIAALWISPKTWIGAASQTHVHVWAAIFLGGAIASFPIFLAWKQPGRKLTRHVMAVAQMLFSALLIHLTGGRIETHFHVFGSLAFLAFYRDSRVLVTATVVVALDHMMRGIFWPLSVFGVLTTSPWRWVEHAGWVIFEDTFLFISIRQSLRDMREVAARRTKLEAVNADIEHQVTERTAELANANEALHAENTGRKRAEDTLRESEARYRRLFEANPLPMWIYDLETLSFLEINDAAISHYGYRREEFLSMTIADIRPPADKPRLLASVAGADHPAGNASLWRHLKKDGSLMDVEIASHVLDYDGRRAEFVSAFDITERKRAEAERQIISEIARGVITTTDLDELLDLACRSIGKFLYAENCFVALHDPTTDLMHFEFWVDKVDPVPPPLPVGEGFSSYVLRTGQPLLLTEELKARMYEQGKFTKSGSDSPSWLGVPLRTPARTIGVLAVQHYEKEGAYSQRDLEFLSSVGDQIALAIERKRAEEKLKRSEERLAAAQKMVHVGNWEWDVITNEVVWSDEEYRLFGFTPGEKPASVDLSMQCIHPDMRPAATAWIEALLANKKASSLDIRIVRPDGEVRILNNWADVVLDEGGNVACVIGTSQDVTERENAERALAASEERTRLIVATAHDAFIGMDSAGLVTDWNPRAEATLGWSRKEALGQPMHELIIPPKFREMHVRGLKHFLDTGEGPVLNKLIEVSAIHRDGREMPIELMISPIRIGDSFIFSASLRDITERKRAEEELKKAKEAAEAASRAKSEFLANMSHEIRTPMNGIIGMTDLTLETDLNRHQREYLGMVKSSAHSLLGLINDILDFSKIEAGKLELDSIDFSLRDCIGGLLKPLGVRADQKGLELMADILSDVPDHLVGDPMRLRQILINLTDNAIKFTKRGEVVVRVANQSASNRESHLHFSVADTGIGIPPEKQALIFEAFAQADGSTTRTYGGTGLGLSIASQLIQKMHGRFWVESKVGEGTTFHFTARLGVRDTPASTVKHADPRSLEGLRALVVDDNAVNRRMLRDMLLNWRMKPTVVESGQAGLDEMLRAAKSDSAYQLVLLDAIMPEMDGFALAEKIKDRPELAGATVMMLSSPMPAGSAARCGALGIAGWLTKPVTQSELLDAILIAVRPGAEGGNSRELDASLAGTEPAGSGLRILVAEDNLVNRAVVTGILEKEGHLLVHVATGREAVEAFSDGCFDLILMDVQMPEMDGFEATRRIRELEEGTGRHITIVAVTAHAMADDRERCLAAGMDDYVSKPLRKEDLLRALNGAVVEGDEDETDSPIPTGPRPASQELLVDIDQLRDVTDDEPDRMQQLIDLYLTQAVPMLDGLNEAIQTNSSGDVARIAHKLVGSSVSCGVAAFTQPLRELERLGHAGDLSGAHALFDDVRQKFPRVQSFFTQFVQTLQSSDP
jgi:two-component system, sensor histidine kinase and response regulator